MKRAPLRPLALATAAVIAALALPACETTQGLTPTLNGQPVSAAKPSWRRSAFAFTLGWNGINIGFAVPAAESVPPAVPEPPLPVGDGSGKNPSLLAAP